jgi:hypothetical protein
VIDFPAVSRRARRVRGDVADPGLLVVDIDDRGGDLDHDLEVGRARRRPPWWLAVAVATALAVAAVLSRQHRDTAAPRSHPTTVAATSSFRPPTPSGANQVVPTGLVAFVASALFDRPGLSVVELDTGRVRQIMTGAVALPSFGAVATMGDAAVVLTDDGLVAAHPEGGLQELGAAPAPDPGGVAAYDAGRADALWRVSGDAGQLRAELLTDTGTVARRVELPDGYVALAGDGLGGLLVVSPDRHLWRIPPDRDGVERVDSSLPLAVNAGHLATVRCDDRFVCGVEVVDLASGNRHLIPGSLQPGTFAALSPNGTRLAQVLGASDAVGTSTVLAVFDTGSGAQLTRQPYPSIPNGPPQWSPDGRWLVWSDYRGLQVWNVADVSAPRSIAVPTGGGDGLTVMAVVARSA